MCLADSVFIVIKEKKKTTFTPASCRSAHGTCQMWTKVSCAALRLQIYINRDKMEDSHHALRFIPLCVLSETPSKSQPYLTSSNLAYSPQWYLCSCAEFMTLENHRRRSKGNV